MSTQKPYETWSIGAKIYWIAWTVTSAAAIGLDVKALLIPLVASFFAMEAPGLLSRVDRWPTLTEMIGHYVPGWLSFPLMGLMLWRLWEWIPEAAVVTFASWLVWHFDKTYEKGV